MDRPANNLRGALFALLAFALFSTHDVVVKFLGGFYAPFQIVFFSVLFGFPLATIMLMRDRTDGNLRPRHPWWTALRTLASVLTGVSAFFAFSTLPMAQTYAILFASPLLITVLAIPVLGERVGPRRWGAVIVGLAGVLIVLRPGQTDMGLGHLAALVAAVGSATASIIVRKIGQDERPVVLLLYPLMANFLLMAMIMPFVYEPMPGLHLGGLVLMSVLAFGAMLLVILAYRDAEAAVVAPMQYSQILWASAYGFFFFSETVDGGTLIGASVIIASGLYILFRESNVSQNRPVSLSKGRPDTGTAPRASVVARLRKRADPLP